MIAEIYIYDVALILMVTIKLKLQGPSGEGCDLRLAPAVQVLHRNPQAFSIVGQFIMMHIEGESKNHIYGKTMH